MSCRVSVYFDDEHEKLLDELRSRSYPKMSRAQAAEMLVGRGLRMPEADVHSARHALLKAEQSVNTAMNVLRFERNRLERQPKLEGVT